MQRNQLGRQSRKQFFHQAVPRPDPPVPNPVIPPTQVSRAEGWPEAAQLAPARAERADLPPTGSMSVPWIRKHRISKEPAGHPAAAQLAPASSKRAALPNLGVENVPWIRSHQRADPPSGHPASEQLQPARWKRLPIVKSGVTSVAWIEDHQKARPPEGHPATPLIAPARWSRHGFQPTGLDYKPIVHSHHPHRQAFSPYPDALKGRRRRGKSFSTYFASDTGTATESVSLILISLTDEILATEAIEISFSVVEGFACVHEAVAGYLGFDEAVASFAALCGPLAIDTAAFSDVATVPTAEMSVSTEFFATDSGTLSALIPYNAYFVANDTAEQGCAFSQSDAATASDEIPSRGFSMVETPTVTDSLALTLSLSEGISSSDLALVPGFFSDVFAFGDVPYRYVPATEGVTATDLISEFVKLTLDTATVADLALIPGILADLASFGDSAAVSPSIGEGAGAADVGTVTAVLSGSESLLGTDAGTLSVLLETTDDLTATDVASQGAVPAYSEFGTATESVSRGFLTPEGVSAGESWSITISVSEGVTAGDGVLVPAPATDAVTASDLAMRVASINEAVTASEAATLLGVVNLTEAITASEVATLTASMSTTDAVSGSDSPSLGASFTAPDTGAASDEVSARGFLLHPVVISSSEGFTIGVAVSEGATITDSSQVPATQTDAATASDEAFRNERLIETATASEQGTVTAVLSTPESITLTDAGALAAALSGSDSLAGSDLASLAALITATDAAGESASVGSEFPGNVISPYPDNAYATEALTAGMVLPVATDSFTCRDRAVAGAGRVIYLLGGNPKDFFAR